MIISTVHRGTFHAGEDETKVMPAISDYPVTMHGFEPEILRGDNIANYPQEALNVVHDYLSGGFVDGQIPEFNLYIVWFAKTLKNWKSLVGTTLVDGRYYEVTYNGDKDEIYLDDYRKVEKVVYRRGMDRG